MSMSFVLLALSLDSSAMMQEVQLLVSRVTRLLSCCLGLLLVFTELKITKEGSRAWFAEFASVAATAAAKTSKRNRLLSPFTRVSPLHHVQQTCPATSLRSITSGGR